MRFEEQDGRLSAGFMVWHLLSNAMIEAIAQITRSIDTVKVYSSIEELYVDTVYGLYSHMVNQERCCGHHAVNERDGQTICSKLSLKMLTLLHKRQTGRYKSVKPMFGNVKISN